MIRSKGSGRHGCAEASEAAGAQSKFWEMHTLLFERQQALRTKDLIHYGEELNLDVERFHNELKTKHTASESAPIFLQEFRTECTALQGCF